MSTLRVREMPKWFFQDQEYSNSSEPCTRELLSQIEHDFFVPATRQRESILSRFESLAREWRAETSHLSSTTEMCLHHAYQAIIGMGEDVLPMLLAEMESAPDHWDWALSAVTGLDPVPEEHYGDIDKIAEIWVLWGKESGYL